MQYIPNNKDTPITLPLNNFQIQSWWADQYGIAPEQAAPDISNIIMIEIASGSMLTAALNQTIVKSIKFHGKWLSHDQRQSLILLLWMVSAAIYLFPTLLHINKSMKEIQLEKKQLETVNRALHLKKTS